MVLSGDRSIRRLRFRSLRIQIIGNANLMIGAIEIVKNDEFWLVVRLREWVKV